MNPAKTVGNPEPLSIVCSPSTAWRAGPGTIASRAATMRESRTCVLSEFSGSSNSAEATTHITTASEIT
ncbi:unannotated protein [freshwater metagenome]|uniref:Unannotated protein n=1 Tax=freshwater metagenome TaxID=449393 RepID=A0A6J7PNN1_9ZZZZ